MKYLGYVISEEGITVNLENIVLIMECPTPKDVSDVIMGLEGYY